MTRITRICVKDLKLGSWIPSTRKELRPLDPRLSCAVKTIDMAVVVLWFDSQNNDYKVAGLWMFGKSGRILGSKCREYINPQCSILKLSFTRIMQDTGRLFFYININARVSLYIS